MNYKSEAHQKAIPTQKKLSKHQREQIIKLAQKNNTTVFAQHEHEQYHNGGPLWLLKGAFVEVHHVHYYYEVNGKQYVHTVYFSKRWVEDHEFVPKQIRLYYHPTKPWLVVEKDVDGAFYPVDHSWKIIKAMLWVIAIIYLLHLLLLIINSIH